jgi:fructosamine-3-kinase
LLPQLELASRVLRDRALAALGERVVDALPDILRDHAPVPSLVHGDLWGGNWSCVDAAPVLFDPAVYHGDREVDLAMTMLFGGFPQSFYDAYNEQSPLPAGHARRRELYNVYHVLNHANLFGGGYAAQARAMMEHLLRAR